jgi:hypothetical protein
MKKEQVILYPLIISKQGSITSFQIKIPSDVKRIVGIETTVRGLENIGQFTWDPPMYDLLRMRSTMVAGYLNLQSTGKQSVCFQREVRLHDNSVFQGDFSQNTKLRSFGWIRGIKREMTPLVLDEEVPSVIFGTYFDRYAKLWQQDIIYTVNIYLWYSNQ